MRRRFLMTPVWITGITAPVALVLLFSATGMAQAPLSHLFLGSPLLDGSGVLLDGSPAPAHRVVIATNAAGAEVGRDAIDDAGSWAIAVSPVDATLITLSVLGADGASPLLPVTVGGRTTIALRVTSPAVAPTRAVPLAGGWNLVGWTGGTTPVAEAIGPIAAQVDTLFRWDASARQFRSFSPSALPFLNSLESLQFGDGLWIRIQNPLGATWTQPVVVVTRAVPLAAGWNLVLWTGPDGTYVVDAVEEIAGRLTALFTWDAAALGFLSYRPDALAFLNTALVLRSGQGVWILLASPATWNQPAP